MSPTKVFYQLLANTLAVSVVNYTVWFAITFYVYLQTKSVLATGIMSGIYLVIVALTGIWFGSLVDHHKKKTMLIVSSLFSLALYAVCLGVYQATPHAAFQNTSSPMLWVFIVLILLGVIASNIRTIATPTLVTILIPEGRRDKANGLVGTVTGTSFLVTSVISGLLVAAGGMFYVLILAIITLIFSILHLFAVPLHERGIVHLEGAPKPTRKIDLRGTINVIKLVPGLPALIVFSTFNNFLGGVFMALMDAYGLSLISVQAWGFLWGFLSTGFIIGGLLIAKTGLGKNPLRTLMLINVILWTVTIGFTMHQSIILLAAGMYAYMCLMPYAEASEQTILQKVVPLERQGRVFGFAQSVEQAASPLTAFLIGPLTQLIFIPFMTTGRGADLIGSWFGTGPSRGIALVFTLTGLIGLIATIIAVKSPYYTRLSQHYRHNHSSHDTPGIDPNPPVKESATT